jgi:Flp pilus assembly protein TadG
MRSLLTRSREESGQVFVFVAFILVCLVGMAALVVDVGSWYQAQRKLQTAADAAALAGAQELPLDQSKAKTVAKQYAQLNYAGIPAPAVTTPDAGTIDVVAEADTPGIFAPVLNSAFELVTVHAEAQAKVAAPKMLAQVAPIALHTSIACIVTDPGCYGQTKTLTLVENAEYDPTKSKFGLLNLDRAGNASASDLKGWIENGYSDHLPIDTHYPPANGTKNGIKKELEDAADDQRTLFFPVYESASSGQGYYVIGWAAFVLDEVVKWSGKHHELKGHFVTYIATSLAAGDTITDPDKYFGVNVITLTK